MPLLFGSGIAGGLTGLDGSLTAPSGGGGVGIGSGLINQHQVAPIVNPRNGQRPIDANQVRANDVAIATAFNAHDANSTVHVQSSTTGARPAPGVAGRKWFTADDTLVLGWLDTGTQWLPLTVAWGDVINKPSTFTPAAHSAALVTSGTLDAARLPGTVVQSSAANTYTARQNMGAGGEALALLAGTGAAVDDHVFFGLYPRGATPSTRWAYVGFGGEGVTTLQIAHEQSGDIQLNTAGTSVFLRASGRFEMPAAVGFGATNYTFPATVGTTGQVLTTDGAGALSWVTPAGGGGGGSVDWTAITGRPSLFPPSAHTHSATEITAGTFPLGVQIPANQLATGPGGTAISAGVLLPWSQVTGAPATFPPAAHTQAWSTITGVPATLPSDWNTTINRPATFTPSPHRHGWAELDNIPATFAPSAHTHPWDQITSRPTTFVPSAHTHVASDITNLSTAISGKADLGGSANFSVLTVNGTPVASLIVSESAPSGAAAQNTFWVQV
jgi:hypothetical protein